MITATQAEILRAIVENYKDSAVHYAALIGRYADGETPYEFLQVAARDLDARRVCFIKALDALTERKP